MHGYETCLVGKDYNIDLSKYYHDNKFNGYYNFIISSIFLPTVK